MKGVMRFLLLFPVTSLVGLAIGAIAFLVFTLLYIPLVLVATLSLASKITEKIMHHYFPERVEYYNVPREEIQRDERKQTAIRFTLLPIISLLIAPPIAFLMPILIVALPVFLAGAVAITLAYKPFKQESPAELQHIPRPRNETNLGASYHAMNNSFGSTSSSLIMDEEDTPHFSSPLQRRVSSNNDTQQDELNSYNNNNSI